VIRAVAFTALALVAFAANSILCRLALAERSIDAASFTTIRLAAGAGMLLVVASRSGVRAQGGDWASAGLLVAYAVPFAFAYGTLSTGTGALILFACVQTTMIMAAIAAGERPSRLEWTGIAAALAGLVYLVSPGLSAPHPVGAGLMSVAGISWAFYSIRGRRVADALLANSGNFLRAVPLAVLASAVTWPRVDVSARGAWLALVSGGVTSGLGYVIWYRALRHLTTTRAAIVQIPVPLLTAIGGVIFLSEAVSFRLVVASVLILGGVGLAIVTHNRS
jgi:drug/metabolite transporter (DMT)-like permease